MVVTVSKMTKIYSCMYFPIIFSSFICSKKIAKHWGNKTILKWNQTNFISDDEKINGQAIWEKEKKRSTCSVSSSSSPFCVESEICEQREQREVERFVLVALRLRPTGREQTRRAWRSDWQRTRRTSSTRWTSRAYKTNTCRAERGRRVECVEQKKQTEEKKQHLLDEQLPGRVRSVTDSTRPQPLRCAAGHNRQHSASTSSALSFYFFNLHERGRYTI